MLFSVNIVTSTTAAASLLSFVVILIIIIVTLLGADTVKCVYAASDPDQLRVAAVRDPSG